IFVSSGYFTTEVEPWVRLSSLTEFSPTECRHCVRLESLTDRRGVIAEDLGLVQRPMAAEGLALATSNGIDAQFAQLKQSIQLPAAEGGFFPAALHFHELAAAGHH